MRISRLLMHVPVLAVLATALAAPLGAQGIPVKERKNFVVADTFYTTLSATHPVFRRIKAGDTITTRTLASGGVDENGVQRNVRGNAMTGPFFVEGAEEGDALVITLLKVRTNRDWGWTPNRLALFTIAPETVESLYPRDRLRWEIDNAKNVVRLRDSATKAVKLEFPTEPMLGVIGVAPAGEFAPTSGPSGSYGGNMDFNEVREGATLSLPVYHTGAYLYFADGHALMADGEPTGAGIETSMDVQFTVSIRKSAHFSMPRLENRDYIYAIASQAEFVSSLDRSLRQASSEMLRWLQEDYHLDPVSAHMLIGYQGQYEVITVGGSMALKLAKAVIPKR